jgi:hypothetical protein
VDRRRLVLSIALVLAVGAVVVAVARSGFAPPAADSDPEEAAGAPQQAASSTPSSAQDGPESVPDRGLFSRSADGAVAAATAYGLALDGPEVFDTDHRERVLDEVASVRARDELGATFDEGLELIATHLGIDEAKGDDPGFVWRVVPGGWQLRDFDPHAATVAIWAAVVVMADDALLVEPGWRTTEVKLAWEGGGWRLVGFQTEPGPNPTGTAGAPDGVSVGRQINAFAPYRHWPDQVVPEVGR